MDLESRIKELFPDLSQPQLLHEILEVGVYKEVPAGESILDIGQYIKTTPLILNGLVKIVREDDIDGELLMYYLGPGETCAMSLTCCMRDERSEVRAIAEEDVEMLAIPVRYLDEWMSKYPAWKNFVMGTYRDRFEEMLQTIDNIAFRKMDERLDRYIHNKAKVSGKNELHITHQAIAEDLNTSREVVSRLLKQMERIGEIELGRNKILLLN